MSAIQGLWLRWSERGHRACKCACWTGRILGGAAKRYVILVQTFCRPKILLSHRANTGILGLWWMVGAPIRHDGAIRSESNLEWINANAFIARSSCYRHSLGWAVVGGIFV